MRLHFPATLRNREAIWQVLQPVLPQQGPVLEIASGSGEHVAYFAQRSPGLTWVPSDPVSDHRQSIADWCQGLANVQPPLELDACQTPWPLTQPVGAILAINLIHIAPWEACLGLLQGARQWLRPGGLLFFYGAFHRRGIPSAPSNLAFDQGLRAQNPAWGVRELETVVEAAERAQLLWRGFVEMPANNLSVFFSSP